METQTKAFLIHFLGDLPPLGTNFQNLPHVTVLGHIGGDLGDNYSGLIRELKRFEANPPLLLPRSVEFFGDRGQYEVLTLEDREGHLSKIHRELLGLSSSMGYELDRLHYAGDHFRPHVALNEKTRSIEEISIDSLSLVRSCLSEETGFIRGDILHHQKIGKNL